MEALITGSHSHDTLHTTPSQIHHASFCVVASTLIQITLGLIVGNDTVIGLRLSYDCQPLSPMTVSSKERSSLQINSHMALFVMMSSKFFFSFFFSFFFFLPYFLDLFNFQPGTLNLWGSSCLTHHIHTYKQKLAQNFDIILFDIIQLINLFNIYTVTVAALHNL